MIKKMALNFVVKFWWLLVNYHLCSTIMENLLTWDSATCIAIIEAGYDIDFVAIIRYDLHERAFRVMTKLLFSFLV